MLRTGVLHVEVLFLHGGVVLLKFTPWISLFPKERFFEIGFLDRSFPEERFFEIGFLDWSFSKERFFLKSVPWMGLFLKVDFLKLCVCYCCTLCDVGLDLCLFLVPLAYSMLRFLIYTMHFMKRCWILVSDRDFQSR